MGRTVCNLLDHMDSKGYRMCCPKVQDPTMATEHFLDFKSSYVTRARDDFPKQGSKAPWRLYQNYWLDYLTMRMGSLEDEMEFTAGRPALSRL